MIQIGLCFAKYIIWILQANYRPAARHGSIVNSYLLPPICQVFHQFGLGGKIRTCDTLVPNQELYLTELLPD